MTDTCTMIRRLLCEQIDRTLATDERSELRAHLATCPNCRAFERDLRAGLAGIARLPRVSGSSAVREAVLAGVHPGGRSAWPRGWRDWTGQLMKLGGAVAAFALVAVILMTVFNGAGTGDPDEQPGTTGVGQGPYVAPTATPVPMATVPANADIYAPACTGAQVEFTLSTEYSAGDQARNSPSFVSIVVHAIKSTGGISCRITTPISLVIKDEAGNQLDVQGNGVTAQMDAMVPSDAAQVRFAWLNWCGTAERTVFDVSMPDWGFGSMNDTPGVAPSCDDPTQPSILGQSGIAEATPESDSCRGAATMVTAIDSTTGGVQIWYAVNMDTGCGNDEGGAFRLEEPSGGLLEIEGNDTDLTFTASEAGTFEWVGMLWTNWCGDSDQIKLELGGEEWGFGSWVEETPTCQDANQPSHLTVLKTPPADPWPGDSTPNLATPMPEMTGEPPVCDPATFALTLLPMPSPAFSFSVDGRAGGGSDAPYCIIEGDAMTVTIFDASGDLLPIDRNGETFANYPQGSSGFVWDNWCGEDGPFTITVTIAGRALSLEVANGPGCTHEDESSSLWGPTDSRTRGS